MAAGSAGRLTGRLMVWCAHRLASCSERRGLISSVSVLSMLVSLICIIDVCICIYIYIYIHIHTSIIHINETNIDSTDTDDISPRRSEQLANRWAHQTISRPVSRPADPAAITLVFVLALVLYPHYYYY